MQIKPIQATEICKFQTYSHIRNPQWYMLVTGPHEIEVSDSMEIMWFGQEIDNMYVSAEV